MLEVPALTVEQVDPLPLRAELREVHRAALGAGALSDDWAANRLAAHVQRDDFVFLVARGGTELAGFGYGYTGAYEQWWTERVARSFSPGAARTVARPAALRDRRAARPSGLAAARRRQCAARTAAQPPAARPGAALHADRVEEGAHFYAKNGWTELADVDFGANYPPYLVLGKNLVAREAGTRFTS